MAMTLVQKHDRVLRRCNKLLRLERRIAAWMQGWGGIVGAIFVAKLAIDAIPWWAVAAVAGLHTALFWPLNAVNVYKYRTFIKRAEAEAAAAEPITLVKG